MNPSDPVRYTPLPAGKLSPLGRREHIRDSLDKGDWQTAAHHLHEAHTSREWLRCGDSSWSDYVAMIGVSRMYDWQLRLTARMGTAKASYTVRAAIKAAKAQSPRLADAADKRAPV